MRKEDYRRAKKEDSQAERKYQKVWQNENVRNEKSEFKYKLRGRQTGQKVNIVKGELKREDKQDTYSSGVKRQAKREDRQDRKYIYVV